MKKFLLVLLSLALIPIGMLAAQGKSTLTIQSNQAGANVYIDDQLVGVTNPSFSTLLSPGRYEIKVAKSGYPEFKTRLNMGNTAMTVIANLGPGQAPVTTIAPPPPPSQHRITVTSNVPNSRVFINSVFAGQAPFSTSVSAGSYSVSVRAEGYEDYLQNVVVNAPVTINAMLSRRGFDVSIDTPGVRNAEVYRDAVWIGRTPYRDVWPAGTYTVSIRADGYSEFKQNVNVNGPVNLQATLYQHSHVVNIDTPGIRGAEVYRNGSLVGRTPYRDSWAPGSYTVSVRADGYTEYRQSLMVTGPVSVQATLFPIAHEVNIDSPGIRGAEVYRNGSLVGRTPYRDSWAPGSYSVSVRAEGYTEYRQSLVVNGPVSVQATLFPIAHEVIIDSPGIRGAEVYRNGTMVGRTPYRDSWSPGTYAIAVRADGYSEFRQSIAVNAPVSLQATLFPLAWEVNIDSPGFRGAEVYRNGSVVGKTPYRDRWSPGAYNVVVKLPGYSDYVESFNLTGPKTISAAMQMIAVPFEVKLPESLLERDGRGPKWKAFRMYIDRIQLYSLYGSIVPGKHIFTMEVGDLSFETTFMVQSGGNTIIEPYLMVKVTP